MEMVAMALSALETSAFRHRRLHLPTNMFGDIYLLRQEVWRGHREKGVNQ